MRTTLTLDDDVAAVLRRLQKERETSWKTLVNETLRRGLLEMSQPQPRRWRPRRKPVSLGPLVLDNVDNVAEVLALAEGEDHR